MTQPDEIPTVIFQCPDCGRTVTIGPVPGSGSPELIVMHPDPGCRTFVRQSTARYLTAAMRRPENSKQRQWLGYLSDLLT